MKHTIVTIDLATTGSMHPQDVRRLKEAIDTLLEDFDFEFEDWKQTWVVNKGSR
jgi:hypothetical protein